MTNFKKDVSENLLKLGFVAGIILIVISSIFTAILFESLATGTMLGKILAVAGICVDIGKVVSASTFVYFIARKKMKSALLCLTFYICAFGISMVASQSLDINKSNVIKQKNLIASDEYKMSIDSFESANKSIARYLTQIEELKSNKQNKINDSVIRLQAEKERAKANDWITTPLGSPRRGVDVISADIARVKKETESQIQSQISALENKISMSQNLKIASKQDLNELKTTGRGVVSTEGLIAFANWVDPYQPDKVLGWFYLFKNIFTEILGTFLLLIYNYNFKSAKSQLPAEKESVKPNPTKTYTVKPKKINTTTKPSIGFKTNSNNIGDMPSEKDIKRYIQHMENPKQKGICRGYKKISELTGLKQEDCRTIKGILERRKIIETIGTKTKIIG